MGAYKYISQTLQKQYKERSSEFRSRVITWRKEGAIVKVERPSNISRARRLGYKAKQGYIVARVRIEKGRRTRRKPRKGRKHKSNYTFVQPQISHQAQAEQRANRKFRNLEVLNSYWVGEDGNFKYFEIILADASKSTVNVSSVIRQGKAFRGLTSSGNSRSPSKRKTPNKRRRRESLIGKVHSSAKPYQKKTKPKAEKKKTKMGSKAKKAAKKKAAKKK
jgi:large subunit ribosomal protein L15e